MSNWNLPPGCTDADIDRAFGGSEGRRGIVHGLSLNAWSRNRSTLEIEGFQRRGRRATMRSTIASGASGSKVIGRLTTTTLSRSKLRTEEEDPDDARDARIDYRNGS